MDDDLEWDSHVGWEPRYRFAPGETSHRRAEGSFLTLEYILDSDMFAAIAARSAGLPLRDKPLIVRDAAELCHPALHDVVGQQSPDRLLVDIDGNLNEAGRDCLARLSVPNLFLSTCRHDGALRLVDPCLDGDAQLALIASSAELRTKVRGLAIGFGEETSWRHLPQFARLTHLAIRGPALEQIDMRAAYALCDLGELQYVDALIPEQPGSDFNVLPPACVMRWSTFRSWTISAPDMFLGRQVTPPPRDTPCNLRRVVAWEIDADQRRRLAEACPRLDELDVIDAQERCERRSAREPLQCRRLRD